MNDNKEHYLKLLKQSIPHKHSGNKASEVFNDILKLIDDSEGIKEKAAALIAEYFIKKHKIYMTDEEAFELCLTEYKESDSSPICFTDLVLPNIDICNKKLVKEQRLQGGPLPENKEIKIDASKFESLKYDMSLAWDTPLEKPVVKTISNVMNEWNGDAEL